MDIKIDKVIRAAYLNHLWFGNVYKIDQDFVYTKNAKHDYWNIADFAVPGREAFLKKYLIRDK